MLFRVRIVCRGGHAFFLFGVRVAQNRDALPDQKDGDPTEGKANHGDDSNAILGGPAFAVLDVEETHGRVVFWGAGLEAG